MSFLQPVSAVVHTACRADRYALRWSSDRTAHCSTLQYIDSISMRSLSVAWTAVRATDEEDEVHFFTGTA